MWGLICAMMPAEQHGAGGARTPLLHATPQAAIAENGKVGGPAKSAEDASLGAEVAAAAASGLARDAGCPCCSPSGPFRALPTPLQVRAAIRLSMLLDGCAPDDFALLCSGRRHITTTTAAATTTSSTTARSCSSGRGTVNGTIRSCVCGKSSTTLDPTAPLGVALDWMGWRSSQQASMGVGIGSAGGGGTPDVAQTGDSGPQRALDRGAAVTGARLLLGSLERARRTGWLKVPSPQAAAQQQHRAVDSSGRAWQGGAVQCVAGLRGGFWEGLRAGEVAGMEAWARRVLATGGSVGAAGEPEPCGGIVATKPEGQDRSQGSRGDLQDVASAGKARGGEASGRASKDNLATSSSGGCVPASSATGGSGGGGDAEYDEDGLRTVWDSGPARHVAAARAAWRDVPLRERVAWTQTSTDVTVTLTLPPGR